MPAPEDMATVDIWCIGVPLWHFERDGATHRDAPGRETVMELLGDIRDEARWIRQPLEDEDGEEEAQEDDLDG